MNAAYGRKAPFAVGRLARVAAAVAIIGACGIAPVTQALLRQSLGQPPGYAPSAVSDVPNEAAIDRLIWMPGLDSGWDPQGLAVAGDSILVSAYQSGGAWQHRGPCRVFRVDPKTGAETGQFDVPAPCRHAGGLGYAGAGKLFVADTHDLFEADLDRAFVGTTPTLHRFRLGRSLAGGFAVSGAGDFWLGKYVERGQTEAFRYEAGTVARLQDGATLTAGAASAIISVPSYAEGGAFDDAGNFWISRGDIGWGFLDRLDPLTGRLENRYPICAGIQGIAFDGVGRLWAVSEDGVRHIPWRYPFFPVIFRLDPARLAPVPLATVQ